MKRMTAANHNPERWQALFLEKLAETGHVTNSCTYAQVTPKTAYKHRREDTAFAAAWDEALDTAVSTLEDEAWRRARDGVSKPVYQGGIKVGTIQEYSDTLLIFLLKANRPAKYRESIGLHLDLSKLSDEELAKLAEGRRP